VVRVRHSRPDDGPALQDIERTAGERFRTVDMGWVADDEPPSLDDLTVYAQAGRGWVAVDAADRPVGYVVVEVVDGNAHIEQVTVAPDHQGGGVGRALIDHVVLWARDRGSPAITLTTFTDVPWNRPLYEHLGFRVLAEHEIGDELRTVRANESVHGLDPTTRVCMLRDVAPGSTS
jgi:GNAT superfamily N-acetyltransferase